MLKLKIQYFGHLIQRTASLEKTLVLRKIEGRRRRGRQDEMVGGHPQFHGLEFEQITGVNEGQESLVFCIPLDGKVSDTTEQVS